MRGPLQRRRSADQVLLDDIERWTYTPTDISAVNYYTGGMHTGGENVGWRIDPGDYLRSDSVLKNPGTFPVNLKQTVGRPMLITECSWTDPSLYQTEGPFMVCAYESLTGVDCMYWFAYGNAGYEESERITFLNVKGQNPLRKWSGNTPQQAGISIDLIKHFAGKRPVLGVCLGHQAMGAAFGGDVVRAKNLMHGKTSMVEHDGRTIFQNVPSPMQATRYHSLMVEEPVADCLEITAFTSDGVVMGVKHKAHHTYGVQFHPESILTQHGKQLLKNFLAIKN